MKILIDFRKFDGVIGGVERGVIEITRYLASWGHTVTLLPKAHRLSAVQALFEGAPNIEYIPLNVKSHVLSLRNVFLDSFVIQDIARQKSAEVIHFPYNWSFPFLKAVPTLLTVHDVIPLTFREAQGRFTNLFLYRPGMRLATRLNNLVVTVSQFSRQDICHKLGVPLQKVRVINNGLRNPHEPDEALIARVNQRLSLLSTLNSPTTNLPNTNPPFVLYVGGIHERKNVVGLIHAFAMFVSQTGFPGKLLVTGNVSGAPYQVKMKAIHDAAVQQTGMQDRVVFTGFIPDDELDYLMRRALFLVYPSFYEGFGIPVLEAMQVSTPVITSSTTAMPEVAGDAALLVDPHDIKAIAEAMTRLLKDDILRRELGEKGKQRAKGYTWEKTTREYLDLYTELASSSRQLS